MGWTHREVDRFVTAYIECALWSSTDDDGESLEGLELSDSLAARMLSDCEDFMGCRESLLREACEMPGYDLDRAGHDFWLTRNRHGAGFWDRGLGKVGQMLTDYSHAYGEVSLYVDADGAVSLE